MKRLISVRKGFLRAVYVLLATLVLGSGLLTFLPQAAGAYTQPNELQLLGSSCNNLNTNDYTNTCDQMRAQLANFGNGACNNLTFQDPNHQDNWFVNLPNYRTCYDKAASDLKTLGSNNCKKLDGSNTQGSDWQNCKGAQGDLYNILGCDSQMYKVSGTANSIISSKLPDCSSRLQAAGNVKLEACPDHPVSSSQCEQIATQRTTSSDNANTDNGGGGTSGKPSCEDTSGFGLGWIVCKVVEGMAATADFMYSNIIQPLLATDPINITNPGHDPTHTYQIWSQFRVYGDVFLVIALLVIVFGESVGGGMIDAYTVKKVLPRLLIAAILINLSIYIVALALDVTNVLGKGLEALIQAPFQDAGGFKLSVNAGAGGLGMVALLGAAGVIWKLKTDAIMFIVAFVVVPAVLMLLAIMATVIFRRGLIMLLILVSPVAFALYCLPNTQQYFRKWWDTLFKTLLIYPIIAVAFAMGNVLAVTMSSTTTGLLTGSIAGLLGMIALFVPLAMIPFSFRIAGGVMAQAFNAIDKARQGADTIVRGDAKNPDSWRNRMKRNFDVGRNEIGLNSKGISARLARPQDILSPEGRTRRADRLAAVREAGRTSLGGQFAESDPVYQANQKNDQYLLALANERMAQDKRRAALASGNMTEVAAWDQAIGAARATPSNSATRMRAVQDLAATGFQFDEMQAGYDQLAETVADITGAELTRDAAGHVTGARGINAGAFANGMNQAQYNLRSAGRFDLGGINNGEGFDVKASTDKGSLYELANGKVQSITALADPVRSGMADTMQHAIVYKELQAMLPNAKGASRDAIVREMKDLEFRGVQAFMSTDAGTGQSVERRVNYDATNPAHVGWSTDEKARGWRTERRPVTLGDLAQDQARSYERPDPNRV